jgi:hypothetical protein
VNVPKSTSNPIKDNAAVSEPAVHATAPDVQTKSKSDPDLQRAKDLVELHYTVKLQYLDEGLDAELHQAREDVKRVSRNLASQGFDS